MSAFKLVLALLLSLPLVAYSQEVSSSKGRSEVIQSSLTETEQSHAKLWKLTEKEYERYKEILRSPRAYYTPNLDKNPLLALSLEEKSPQKRQEYADRWVQLEFDNVVKVVSWQLEVSKSWKRQYPGVPRFSYKDPSTSHYAVSNMSKGPKTKFSPTDLTGGASFDTEVVPRAQLYVKADDCAECIVAFKKQYTAMKLGKIAGVDVHFVDNPTKESIGRWAVNNGLTAKDVNNARVVTLNFADKDVDAVPKVEFN